MTAPDFDGGVTPLHWRYVDAHGDPLWTCPRCGGKGWHHAEDLFRTVRICPSCRGRCGFTAWTLAVVLAEGDRSPEAGVALGGNERRAARVAWYRRVVSVLSMSTLEGARPRTRTRTASELLERLAWVFTRE